MLGREQLHQPVLRRVRVLELVDQDVLEAPLPVGQALGMLPEQGERVEQQVVEVHRIRLLQRGSEHRVDLGRDPLQRALRPGAELFGEEHAVLGARDDGVDRPGRIRLG